MAALWGHPDLRGPTLMCLSRLEARHPGSTSSLIPEPQAWEGHSVWSNGTPCFLWEHVRPRRPLHCTLLESGWREHWEEKCPSHGQGWNWTHSGRMRKFKQRFKKCNHSFSSGIVGRESCLLQQIGLQIANHKYKVLNWWCIYHPIKPGELVNVT